MIRLAAERTADQLLAWLLEVRAVRRVEPAEDGAGYVVTLPDGCLLEVPADAVAAFHRGVLVGWRLPRVAT